VRFLLDAHNSGKRVGAALATSGHDVRALDSEPELEGLADGEVLELAAGDGRILITHNVADFPTILREWAIAGRSHAGMILVYGFTHREIGSIVNGIEWWLRARPHQEDWIDFPAVLSLGLADRAILDGAG
jgi:hypothetical protein